MRNIWRIFRDDLSSMKGNAIPVIVLLALCLVPALLAWFGIAGGWDPYAHSSQLKVAVANSDEGYESDLIPFELNIGDRVVNMLNENDDYAWTFVDEEAALDGVRSGEYYAAIVIPAGFSSKMMSALSSGDEQVSVAYYLNMKENPIAPMLAGEGGPETIEDIRVKFTEAVDEMSLGLASDLVSYASSDNAKELGARLVAHLGDVADSLDASADQLRMYAELSGSASSLVSAASKALSGSADAADASGGVIGESSKALDAAVSRARSAVSDIEQQVESVESQSGLDKVGTDEARELAEDVSSLASSISSISREADSVAETLQKAAADLAGEDKSMAGDLDTVRNDLGAAANKLGASASKIRKFQDDMATAISRGSIGTVASMVGGSTANLAQWLANPVQIEKRTVYPVENFGSSIAPFYTVLAIWIGALMLVLLMRTDVSEARIRGYEEECGRPLKNYEQYLGRFLTFAVLALVQATVVALGDLIFLRIQCVHPLLFVVACWVCAIVFSNIVYTLAVSFGGIGKALCIVLLALQVVGVGSDYPAQMIGGFFQTASLCMPFAHGAHAMLAAVAGIYGTEFVTDILFVAAFLVPSLLIGLALRRPLIRVSAAFSAKMEDTGLM